MRLKLSFKMDMLTMEQKDKSISFANAMNAIEANITKSKESKYETIGDYKIKDYTERPHEYVKDN